MNQRKNVIERLRKSCFQIFLNKNNLTYTHYFRTFGTIKFFLKLHHKHVTDDSFCSLSAKICEILN